MADAAIHTFTASDGIELAWREWARGGRSSCSTACSPTAEMNWIKFGTAERIAREGFRVIMPDLRAHGLSGKPHEPEHYPQGSSVRDLRELVAHLGLADFDLGGFSLGARTTVEAVARGMRPRRAILGGAGLEGLHNWERRKPFLPRGDRHVRHGPARRPALAGDPVHEDHEGRPRGRRACCSARCSTRRPAATGSRPSPCRPWSCAATRTTTMARRTSLPTPCPMPTLREMPGTHMSSRHQAGSWARRSRAFSPARLTMRGCAGSQS